MDRYSKLREALDSAREFGESCFVELNSADIRDLLAERDALEVAVKEASEVIIDRNDEIRMLREALETIADYPYYRDSEMAGAALMKIARAALAQGET